MGWPPERAGRDGGETTTCPNCGAAGAQRYCPVCGQDQRDPRRSPLQWLRDVAAEELGLDDRVPRSVRLLLLRPGRLTAEWIEGRRARYVSPLRLFVVMSALFFAWTFFLGMPVGRELELGAPLGGPGHTVREIMDNAVSGYVQAVATLSAFGLVPVFALWLTLVQRKTEHVFADHLVFSLHQHTVLLLLVSAAWPLLFFDPWHWLGLALVLAAVPHTVLAYRRVYGGPKWVRRFTAAALGWGLGFLVALGVPVVQFGQWVGVEDDPVKREYALRLWRDSYEPPAGDDPGAQRVLWTLSLEAFREVSEEYREHLDIFHIADLEDQLGDVGDSTLVALESMLEAYPDHRHTRSRVLAAAARAERGDTARAVEHLRGLREVMERWDREIPDEDPYAERFRSLLATVEGVAAATETRSGPPSEPSPDTLPPAGG